MEPDEAMKIARRYLNDRGLPHYNLFMFDLPSPAGFRFRNSIGLSELFVRAHDAGDVADTVLHEIAHGWAADEATHEENRDHGLEFEACARRLDAIPEAKKFVDGKFGELVGFYNKTKALTDAGQRCMARICEELGRWADAGIQGHDDAVTFLDEPYILKSGA